MSVPSPDSPKKANASTESAPEAPPLAAASGVPVAPPLTGKDKFRSSTARINFNLVLMHLKVQHIEADHPAMKALSLYTVVNIKTGQMRDAFHTYPDAPKEVEKIEATLGKLRLIASDPAKAKTDGPEAKKNYDNFNVIYKGPAEKVKQTMAALEKNQEEYNALVDDEHDKITDLLNRIQNAPTSTSSSALVNVFSTLEARRAKIQATQVKCLDDLKDQQTSLSEIYLKAWRTLPPESRSATPETTAPRKEL
jgi:hypothetical protein